MHGTPKAEVFMDEALVRSLLAEQHPDLADLPLCAVDAGWDNAMFRLGEELAVRLPRRQLAAQLIEHEQKWLPYLSMSDLHMHIPLPRRKGVPGCGYPWHWSVVPWIKGDPADIAPPAADQAAAFGLFLHRLHKPTPPNAPRNHARGVPLSQRAAAVEERMARLDQKSDLVSRSIGSIWQEALAAPIDVTGRWIHGDLHPQNILVYREQFSGVIDWGDITSGDVATDLASIWMLFESPEARKNMMDAYGDLSGATLARAKGWAVFFGVVLLDTGLVDNPRHAAIGAQTLRRLTQDL